LHQSKKSRLSWRIKAKPEERAAMTTITLKPETTLPDDGYAGVLAGRVWHPDVDGPSVVAIRADGVFDISSTFPTMRDLCETDDPASSLKAAKGEKIGTLEAILANTPPDGRDSSKPWLIAPNDLQAIKAAGVTFAVSMLERVIEEKARGDFQAAAKLRTEITALIGDDLSKLKPGSPDAMKLKEVLIAQGAWSQYLEVGIGPDAEIFTKAPPMSAVGTGADAGLHPMSTWNNPEPEVVIVVASTGKIVGGMLGNDVNLRDVEGRSALLLGKAKDNNASASIGPFIRFFDASFTLDQMRHCVLSLTVEGTDGYVLKGASRLDQISRDYTDLTAQMLNRNHQYPDGAVLFTGTLFAPIDDRDHPGEGFTHKMGDVVTIATPELGALVNRMKRSNDCAPWTFGTSQLMRNLAKRNLI
jgi:fumarylacetoacetate (FAA) hydrolase family protein